MASTTEIPPTMDPTPSAPSLDSLSRDAPSAASSTTSSTMTSTIDSGKPSTSYAFTFVGSNPTPSSSSNSSSTDSCNSHSSGKSSQHTTPNEPSGSLTDDRESGSGKPTKANVESSPDEGGTSSSTSTGVGGAGDEEKKDDSMFECNICLDTAKDAVVSMCGHLFCWPCIHQWMNGYRNTCPVCKSSISKEKVIPLYGRGGSKEDPRKTVPPRPAGQRTEPEHPTGFQGFTGDSFHMSFGIGAFPFGFFSSTLNFGANYAPGGTAARDNTRESDEDQFLSQVFLYVALVFLAWLAMA